MTHGWKYSRASTNGHLSTTAIFFLRTVHTFTLVSTSLQWPLFSVPKGPRGGRFRKIQLYQNSPPTLPRNSANLILSHLNNRGPIFARFVFQELKNSEIAQRTNDIPPALQHENMAPQEYFQRLVESFEERMLMYRKQIEIMESHMASLSQGQTLTPQGAK